MFVLYKSDNSSLQPWEYMEAAPDDYKAGQMLAATGGLLEALAADTLTTPPYICMADMTITDDELLPVIRVSHDYIYETELSAAAATAAPGGKLAVADGGLFAKAGAGTFEIVSLDGTAAGDAVRGRFA